MNESGENYLETILILEKRYGFVRATDVAEELGYSKPSISRAMNILREAGYVENGRAGHLLLTEKGLEKAEAIYERHCTIARFLMITLGISEEQATTDSCRIEHILSQDTFERIKKYVALHEEEENEA